MNALIQQGFECQQTGGNCTAWVKKLSTGQYMVLTHDTPFDVYPWRDVLIGMYDGSDTDESSTMWGELIGECELDFNTEEDVA